MGELQKFPGFTTDIDDILDEDDMISDSDTALATQQSIKAYIGSNPNNAYTPGGTDVALADGGTGASLADPNDDQILFWDDSAGTTTWLDIGDGLTITDTTISADLADAVFTELSNNTVTTVNIDFSDFAQTSGIVAGSFNNRLSDFNMYTDNANADEWVKIQIQISTPDSGDVGYTQEFQWSTSSFDWSNTIALGQTTNQDVFFGFVDQGIAAGPPANATFTTDHAAFMVDDGILYASVADGTTQNRTDVSTGITLTNYNNYRIIWTAATSAVFQINGSTVATLSTNIPDAALPPIHTYAIESNTTAYAGMKMLRNATFQVDVP